MTGVQQKLFYWLVLLLCFKGYLLCSAFTSFGSSESTSCQFPGEIQGVYATQAPSSAQDTAEEARMLRDEGVTASVKIHHDSVSGWGSCAARYNQRYILSQRSVVGGGHACFRCFHLLVASPNVVVVTSRRTAVCFPSIEDAKASCPPQIHHHHHHYHHHDTLNHTEDRSTRFDPSLSKQLQELRRDIEEIILYKVESAWGDPGTTKVECPIKGVFAFNYERGRGSYSRGADEGALCPHPTSELSNCPYGHSLNIIYRDCAYGQPQQVQLQCLGGWRGPLGVRYLAALDTSSTATADSAPKYRCGMYYEEPDTGRIHLSFSRDATCSTMLRSPVEGYEHYRLTPSSAPPLPSAVLARGCRFPASLQGDWTTASVENDIISFKDDRTLKRYTAVCVDDTGDGEHFVVYSRTHCGDANYNCIWLKRRSANILEFMLGLQPNESLASGLCDAAKFGAQDTWTTVAKSKLEIPTRCPVLGSFIGTLPNASGYCGRLQSECSRPDVMTYTVTDCDTATNAYEQREYRCLGEWTEDDRIYALTYRPDTHSHECFVGIKTPDGRMFIKEAGDLGSCARNVQPHVMGMELQQRAECSKPVTTTTASDTTAKKPQPPARPPWQTQRQLHTTTKPWKPITAPPRRQKSGGCIPKGSYYQLIAAVLTVFIATHLQV